VEVGFQTAAEKTWPDQTLKQQKKSNYGGRKEQEDFQRKEGWQEEGVSAHFLHFLFSLTFCCNLFNFSCINPQRRSLFQEGLVRYQGPFCVPGQECGQDPRHSYPGNQGFYLCFHDLICIFTLFLSILLYSFIFVYGMGHRGWMTVGFDLHILT